jgi:hypothetical protein
MLTIACLDHSIVSPGTLAMAVNLQAQLLAIYY